MTVRNFAVRGPFPVPTAGPGNYKWVVAEELDDFWELNVRKAADARGCYVFALSTSRGALLPIYVGRTSSLTFRNECFTPDKINKAQTGMRGRTGRLVLFLVVYQASRGAPNKKVIRAAEVWLIQMAKKANPNLVNKQGTKTPQFAISGVYNTGVGKRSAAAHTFRKMLRFD